MSERKVQVWPREKILGIAHALHLATSLKKEYVEGAQVFMHYVGIPVPPAGTKWEDQVNYDSFIKILRAENVSHIVYVGALHVYYDETTVPAPKTETINPFDVSAIVLEAERNGLKVDVSSILHDGINISKEWTNLAQVLPFAKLEKSLVDAKIPFVLSTFLNSANVECCRLRIDCFPIVLIKQ